MYIIVGLGNPERKYDGTRHNIGFSALTVLADTYGISMDIKKKERDAKTLKFELGKYIYQQFKSGQEIDDKVKTICSEIDVVYAEIAALEKERENVGADDEIEVIEADVSDADDVEAILDDSDLD